MAKDLLAENKPIDLLDQEKQPVDLLSSEVFTEEAKPDQKVYVEDKDTTVAFPIDTDIRDVEFAVREGIYYEKKTADKNYVLTSQDFLQASTPERTGRKPTEEEEEAVMFANVSRETEKTSWNMLTGEPPKVSKISALLGGFIPPDKQTQEDLKKLYPVESLMGKIGQLAILSLMTGGAAPAVTGYLETTPVTLYPKLIPFLANAVQRGATWGLGGIVDVIAKEPSTEMITHPLSEAAFGVLTGGVHGIENTSARVLSGGIARGAWTAGKALLKDGNIDKSDLTDIAVNFSLGAVFEMINAKVVSGRYKEARLTLISRIKERLDTQGQFPLKESIQLISGERSKNVSDFAKRLSTTQAGREFLRKAGLMNSFTKGMKQPAIVMMTNKVPLNIGEFEETIQLKYVDTIVKSMKDGKGTEKAIEAGINYLIDVLPTDTHLVLSDEFIMDAKEQIPEDKRTIPAKEETKVPEATQPLKASALETEALKYKSAEEFVKGQIKGINNIVRKLKDAEKRVRRAKRQEPSDVDDAQENLINIKIELEELSNKLNLSKEEHSRIISQSKITQTEESKLDDDVKVQREKGEWFDSFMFEREYGRVSGNILPEAQDYKTNEIFKGKLIEISTIQANKVGLGQGKKLIQDLIEYARNNNISYIGSISANEYAKKAFKFFEDNGDLVQKAKGMAGHTVTWEITSGVTDKTKAQLTDTWEKAQKGKEDTSFDFGSNKVDVAKDYKGSGKSPARRRLDEIKDKEVKIDATKGMLDQVDVATEEFKGRIRDAKFDDVKIPAYFRTTSQHGQDVALAVEEFNNMYGEDFSEGDFVNWMVNIDAERVALRGDLKGLRVDVTKKVGEKGALKRIVKQEEKALEGMIKSFEKGAREAKVSTKKQIASNIKEIKRLLKDSELEAIDKAKFISRLTDINKLAKPQEEYGKVIGEIESKVRELEEKATKRKLTSDIKKLTSTDSLKKIRPEFKKELEPILGNLDLTKPSKATLKKLHKLASYMENNPDNQIPKNITNTLKRLEKVPASGLPVETLQDIVDTIGHAIALSNLKNTLIVRGKIRKFKEVRTQALGNLDVNHEALDGSISGLDSFQSQIEKNVLGKVFGADSYNAELKTQILDGKDNEVLQDVIYRGIDKGVDKQLTFYHDAEDFFKAKLKDIDISRWSGSFQKKAQNIDRIPIKLDDGRELTMTKGERVAFILHSRNEANMKHLVNGGFSYSNTPDKINKLSVDDVNKIVSSATPEEIKIADTVSEYFNTLQKDAINETSMNLLGLEVARELEYFPIRTNFLDRFRDELIKAGKMANVSLEGLGIFKERQSASNALIVDDVFVALYKSIKQVGSYVGLAEPLRSAKALLKDNDIQKKVISIGKKQYLESLEKYLQQVEGLNLTMSNVDKITTDIINKVDISILGLNPFVILKQPISYIGATTEIDGKYLTKALTKLITDEVRNEIRAWSPQLRDRFDGNVTRELGELAEVGRVKKFFTGEEVIANKIMGGIKNFDTKTVGRIWEAVKLETADKYPDIKVGSDEFMQIVADRSWFVIRRTQPTFHIKDRSTVGADPSVLTRSLTKYSSQRNKNWMMYRRAYEKYNSSDKTASDKATLAKTIVALAIVSPLLLFAIDEARNKLYSRKEKGNIFKRMTIDVIQKNFGNIYFLGPGVDSMISKIEKGTYAGYDINTTLFDTIQKIVDTGANAIKAVGQAVSGERFKAGANEGKLKWKQSVRNSIEDGLTVTGRIKGVPAEQVIKWINAVERKVKPRKTKAPKIGG